MFPSISLVIPSYNRWKRLQKTLDCLAQQSYPFERMELIVVDDGSVPAYSPLPPLPFDAHLLRQPNQGASVARNAGVQQSRGEMVVFLDDDICPAPTAIAQLVTTCQTAAPKTVVQGKIVTPEPLLQTVFAQTMDRALSQADQTDQNGRLSFTACKSGFFAVWRTDFMTIGNFFAPLARSVAWEDLVWGYRAHQKGYSLLLCSSAVAYHWDYALQDAVVCGLRWEKAGHSAQKMLVTYPELAHQIPMFRDKLPISWAADSPKLILRKGLRWLLSAKIVSPMLLWLAKGLERWGSGRLYLLYVNGCFYRGFRTPLNKK